MANTHFKIRDFFALYWVVGIIIAGEILFRLYYFGVDAFVHPTRYSPRGNTLTQLVIPVPNDPSLVYALRPGVRTYFKGAYFSTNGQGVRNNGINAENKDGDIFRIALIGASVAMGAGVADDETFSASLQEKFNTDFPGDVEVVNFGVGGYTMVQVAAYYLKTVQYYKPDLILLPVYYDGYGSLEQCVPYHPMTLAGYHPPWHNLRGYLLDFFAFNAIREEVGNSMKTYLSVDWLARGNNGQQTSCRKNKEVLHDFLSERYKENVPVVLIALHRPRESTLVKRSRASASLNGWCGTQAGASLIDTVPELQSLVSPADQIYLGDNHPNARVHALYADSIYPKLRDKITFLSSKYPKRNTQ